MRPGILITGFLILAQGLHAAEPEYLRDLHQWHEVAVPPTSKRSDWAAWFYAADYSKREWRVLCKDGKPLALADDKVSEKRADEPAFVPIGESFRGVPAHAPVDDGWLVGFNNGEFGAALYWFIESCIENGTLAAKLCS